MDFDGIIDDTAMRTSGLLNYITNLPISVADRKKLIAQSVLRIGHIFAGKITSDLATIFDTKAINSPSQVGSVDQVESLALKVLRDSVFGIKPEPITHDYLSNVFARNAEQTYRNAITLRKSPTISRRLTDADHCDWCAARAGTWTAVSFTALPREVFRRHEHCHCEITISGAGVRKHGLKNYVKKG